MITSDTLHGILGFQGNGLPVVSLYARFDPGASRRELRTRVSSLLDEIRPVAKDGAAGRAERLSLRGDIARIKDAVSSERWQPGTVAIFTCSGRDWYAEAQLPQPVADRVVVDATPLARPMLAVLEEHERCLVAVVDRASARFWELYWDEVHELDRIRDRLLRKSNYAAGFAEYRVRNKADELAKRHYRHVAGVLGDLLRPGGYDLLLSGQATAKANVRDIMEPWDLPIAKGLQESMHAFQRLDEDIELRPILDELAARPPLDATLSEETQARLPLLFGGISVALARTFKLIDSRLKAVHSQEWEQAFSLFRLLI